MAKVITKTQKVGLRTGRSKAFGQLKMTTIWMVSYSPKSRNGQRNVFAITIFIVEQRIIWWGHITSISKKFIYYYITFKKIIKPASCTISRLYFRV